MGTYVLKGGAGTRPSNELTKPPPHATASLNLLIDFLSLYTFLEIYAPLYPRWANELQ